MLKQIQIPKRIYTLRPLRPFIATLALALLVGGAAVHADRFDEQINALNQQNTQVQGVLNGLATQAGSYQAVINQYQQQINAIQAQINTNQAAQASLQQQITENQQKVDQQKQYLSENIRVMYVDGQLSTIEELATSKNLSDYVDKEAYRVAIQDKIEATIKQIAVLQEQLQKQKGQLDTLVESQKQQHSQLASAQSEQQRLLSFNQDQQNNYNGQLSANSSKIADLRRQQVAANARFVGKIPGGATCGGGYPAVWCNAPMDSIIDSWGMYNRECVSYTAFRVAASGRNMPYWGGRGNANQWDDNARAAGIPVDTNPRAGDVAVSNSGFYGHVMYVESVNPNGTINISQYNADFTGRYSTNTISPAGLVFIHF